MFTPLLVAFLLYGGGALTLSYLGGFHIIPSIIDNRKISKKLKQLTVADQTVKADAPAIYNVEQLIPDSDELPGILTDIKLPKQFVTSMTDLTDKLRRLRLVPLESTQTYNLRVIQNELIMNTHVLRSLYVTQGDIPESVLERFESILTEATTETDYVLDQFKKRNVREINISDTFLKDKFRAETLEDAEEPDNMANATQE